MAHHKQDVALPQRIKGCIFRENPANEFMRNLAATLLVGTLRITVENSAPYLTKFGTLNGYRIGKFTASVSQYNGEQTAILFVTKRLI